MSASSTRLALLASTTLTFLANSPAIAGGNSGSLGGEVYYDNIKVDSSGTGVDGYFGSITGNFTHDWNGYFAALDGRLSYGDESPKGGGGDSTPLELEERVRFGYSFGSLSPYIGIGSQQVFVEGNDNYLFYLPVGMSYGFRTDSGYTVVPNVEYDQVFVNHVGDASNNNSGWGARASLMIGIPEGGNHAWQVGPFARYWNLNESPTVKEYQAGINLRYFW